jgi:hypothetical protein
LNTRLPVSAKLVELTARFPPPLSHISDAICSAVVFIISGTVSNPAVKVI